jgi:hypothetical protein
MEFSLLDIFGIFQKIEFISRLLAKTDITDFIAFALIIGTIYGKMNAGTKKMEAGTKQIVDTFETKFNTFETRSETRFEGLKKDLDTKIEDLKKSDTKNTELIEGISTTLTNTINNVDKRLSDRIVTDKAELKQDIASINYRAEKLQELFYTNVKIKK